MAWPAAPSTATTSFESFTPSNMLIGTCRIDGRRVVVSGGDFTVRGGASDAAVGNKHGHANHLALQWRLPYVRLLDATGGSVRTFEKIGRTYIPTNAGSHTVEELLCTSPVVALALGSVAGLPAVEVCLSHFSVMVRGISQVFAGGPPVVKAALGTEITKEELGDEQTQVYEGGVVDNLADSEEEAFEMARRFLSYLPQNVWELPPRVEPDDDPGRRDEELLSVIPREKRRGYDARALLRHVLDRDSVFELTPHYGGARITALARVNGYPVGVMINNPLVLGGSMDVAAGTKVIRFIQLCNTFHLPMVYFADEPGFMVGLEAQRQGIVRAGAKMVCATQNSRMPWITFIVRQLYGVAGQCHDRSMRGMFKRVAWPSAHWGSMHIEGGTSAALPSRDRSLRRPRGEACRDRASPAGLRLAHANCGGLQCRGHHRSPRHAAPPLRLHRAGSVDADNPARPDTRSELRTLNPERNWSRDQLGPDSLPARRHRPQPTARCPSDGSLLRRRSAIPLPRLPQCVD